MLCSSMNPVDRIPVLSLTLTTVSSRTDSKSSTLWTVNIHEELLQRLEIPPLPHRLISYLQFTLEKSIPHFAWDLYIWHFQWCSLTLHPNGSISSFPLNKSEVKEEKKGIFRQMAPISQLYHCWFRRLTFLHHKISTTLYANGTSEHIRHSRFSDIKWIVSFLCCYPMQCMVLTVNIWHILQIRICSVTKVKELI